MLTLNVVVRALTSSRFLFQQIVVAHGIACLRQAAMRLSQVLIPGRNTVFTLKPVNG